MTDPIESDRNDCSLGLVLGALLLRLWLGLRALQTGIEKYAGTKVADQPVNIDGAPNAYGLSSSTSVKHYALENYHGLPKALASKFEAEPLMSKTLLPIFDKALGPAMVLLGIAILLGIAQRVSLFLLGLLFISLTWGLILIKQDDGVSWLATHMLLIVAALALAPHNRLTVLRKW
jgi:thiosulfate dehydrogenase [quinone] large subunit